MSMRRYEVVFVLAPQLTEEEVKGQTETFTKVAEEKGATVLNVDDWGKRRLAFPVKKNKDGIYIILTIEEERADAVTELERRFRVSDNVIRHLTVRIDEDLKRAEKFSVRRKQRKAQRAETIEAAESEKAEAQSEIAEKPAESAKSPKEESPAEESEQEPEETPAEETAAEEASSDESSEEAEAAEEDEKKSDAQTVEEK